jgi:hypothetical protein
MLIYPDIQATPDSPTIKFYQPREQIDLNKELPRILHTQGWGCGTYFNVQFLNHEKTKLLACGRFVVSEEVETLHTNDANPYQPMTKTVFSRSAEQIGEWWPSIHVGKTYEAAPVSIGTDSESIPVFTGEPKRRGRPPNQPKADNVV